MAERTLDLQLNGAEVIEAVVDRVREAMRRDCLLNPNSAYDWYHAEIAIKLDMHDTGTQVQGEYTVQTTQGRTPAEGELVHVETTMEIEPAPPNEVRVETGQPVPTLTKDERGKEVIEGVRYGRGSRLAARAGKAAKAVLLLIVLGGGLYAQSPDQKLPAAMTLTPTESIALRGLVERNQKIQQEQQQALADLRAIEADIVKNHPGYHLDEATLQLAKDDAAKKDSKPSGTR